ncbi:MAG: hypothetical protein H3C43_10615, partial [Leptonema sp. (in: Bacteria)]|nr:hypothetical protein [Leptonema sp. (in: bacteria)]
NISATEILTILNNLSLTLKDDTNTAIELSKSLINAIRDAITSIQEFFEDIDFQKGMALLPALSKDNKLDNEVDNEAAKLQLLDDLLFRRSFDAKRQIKLFKELLDKKSVNLSEQIIDCIHKFDYTKARELLAPYLEKKS